MTPFERAMKIHEDRYGVMAADGRHWRRTAFGLFCLLALSVVGMGIMALRSRVTPYIVQVDDEIDRVITLMITRHISCVPVMMGQTLIGVISSSDIAVTLQCTMSLFADIFSADSRLRLADLEDAA